MSDSWVFIVGIFAVWVGIGLVLSVFMGRRGHDPFTWGLLGAVLGPLAVVFALFATREALGPPHVRELAASQPGSGSVDVLVGIDGSPEARAAVAAVARLLGTRLGRVTLVTVIPFRAAKEEERRAKAMLQEQAERMAGNPGLDVLEGHPSAALERLAVEGGYDLLVLGTRGTGRSKALLGSAAEEVAKQTTVPVLLVGADGRGRSTAHGGDLAG